MKYVQLQIMHFSTLVDKSALLGPPRRCRPWLVGRGGPTVIDSNKLTAFCHLVQSVQSLCLRQAGFAALTLIDDWSTDDNAVLGTWYFMENTLKTHNTEFGHLY